MKKAAYLLGFLAIGILLSVFGGMVAMWNKEKGNAKNVQEQEGTLMGAERKFIDLVYDDLSDSQKLDLYLPEGGEEPFPLVVFIHGGGWFECDKADGQEKAWLKLLDAGYAVASLNYRLSGEAPHPAGIIDCKTAIRYLCAHAEEFHIDKTKIATAGGSSGGHYSLMVAMTTDNPEFEDLERGYAEESFQVTCAVAWYPAADISAIWRDANNSGWDGFGANFALQNIERYMGKKILDDTDEDMQKASPIHYISETTCPLLLQHGDIDELCPLEQTESFYKKAKSVMPEGTVEMDVLRGANHADTAFETDANMERIRVFLDKYMK